MGVLPGPPPRRLRRAGAAVTRPATHRHRAVLPDWLALYYDEPHRDHPRRGPARLGRRRATSYLDFFGGILTTMTAHALPEVTEAVSEQAGRIVHSSTLYLNRADGRARRADRPLSGIPDARVFFTTSGTEANDTALLLATTYRRSNQVLAMRNSYHGRSFSAVGITGNRGWSPDLACRRCRRCTCTAASAPAARSRDLSRRRVHRRLRRTTCEDLLGHTRRRRRRPDRRADPGRRRLHLAARTGCFAAFQRGPRPSTASCGSPTRCRPAGAAPASTSGAGRRTARSARRTSSPSPRASATACPSAASSARAEMMNCLDANSHLHLRRQPGHHGGRRSPTSTTCWTTTSRATPAASAACSSSGCGRVAAQVPRRAGGARARA